MFSKHVIKLDLLPVLYGLLIWLGMMQICWAELPVSVLYPEMDEPYRAVFEQIIQGIEGRIAVRRYALKDHYDAEALRRSLLEVRGTGIITLGQRALKAAGAFGIETNIIAGAVMSASKENSTDLAAVKISGISLTPDPALLLEHLVSLAPKVKHIRVIHSPADAWIIRLAQEATKSLGLGLTAVSVADLRASAQAYREMLATARSTDAIWLPMDAAVMDEIAILPLVLEHSWNHQVVVFSSSLKHVSKGALFSLYPDNIRLGHSLATKFLEYSAKGKEDTAGFRPLREVRIAVNLRTASHLNLDIAARRGSFDLVFPPP